MQKKIATRDNRQYERVVPVRSEPIIIDINGANFIDILKAGNISLGGIMISVAHEFKGCEIDKHVNLAIKLPTPINKSFSATGKIKHISGDAFGVNFISIHEHGQQMLRKYILFHQKKTSTWKTVRYICHLY